MDPFREMRERLEEWLKTHPDFLDIYAGLVDIHGIWRGKRVPAAKLTNLDRSPIRMPVSAVAVDIWGEDVLENPMFLASGDRDGLCAPTGRMPIVTPGAGETSLALLPVWLVDETGTPLEADPRGALAKVVERFAGAGLKPVVGTELEFYLLNPASPRIEPAISPHSKRSFAGGGVLSIDELQAVQSFLDEVYRISDASGVIPEASVSEGGPGQFEIALRHSEDVLKAADDFVILKHIIRHVARKHGFLACFMAKPFPELSGCGLHVHCSLLDAAGANVFAEGEPLHNGMLRHAIGGALAALPQSTLIFAPHLNSYRRFSDNSLAPTTLSWGTENRTCAIRIPDGAPNARRIEHRVAGADANPHLVITAILTALLNGIETRTDPGLPVDNAAHETGLERIPSTWPDALRSFEDGEDKTPLLPASLSRSIHLCKKQEIAVFSARMTDFEIATYRGTV